MNYSWKMGDDPKEKVEGMAPMVVCLTVMSTDVQDFDHQVSMALNNECRANYTYAITFLQDEHTFYAHIIFTENERRPSGCGVR
jgi:hypothetical protein